VSEGWLAGLEPALIWRHFEALTRIPRPSKAEGPAREHVLAWAGRHGFSAAADAEGNVVVTVRANSGRESAPVVVLQSHVDIVCEREPESSFDPREGRIGVRVDDDWVVADETTLGADNGIGVAAAMAVAHDDAVVHGPLELLFTVSEEQGLDGAKALDASLVSGRLLLNLDGTSDEALTVGCAGSDHTLLHVALAPEPIAAGRRGLRLTLSGAKGGHSGADIATGRTNAIKALARVLSAAFAQTPFGLAALYGGASRNAIPREASAAIAVASVEAFRAAVEEELAAIVRQHTGTDDALRLSFEDVQLESASSESHTRRVLDLLAAIPTGVLAMSPSLPGAVETSTSLTTAATHDKGLTLGSMTRSSNAGALDGALAAAHSVARLGGADIEVRRSYPPWEPAPDSQLLTTASQTYARLFASEPALAVVHGGLECAVLGQRLDGVEMISIGPEIVGPHAPGEKVRISSTQRFYRLLGALLDDLSQ
jgi:dipeptidase D